MKTCACRQQLGGCRNTLPQQYFSYRLTDKKRGEILQQKLVNTAYNVKIGAVVMGSGDFDLNCFVTNVIQHPGVQRHTVGQSYVYLGQ